MKTNSEILARMEEDMVLRGFAEKSKIGYLKDVELFSKFYKGKNLEELSEEDIRKYLIYQLHEKKLRAGSVNTKNGALRFVYSVTLNRNLNYKQIPRLKDQRRLRDILTKEELRRLFESSSTLKNKAMLMTLYGSGARLDEVCTLRTSDIHSDTMRIFVYDGKNNKDRYTILSQVNLDILREYFREYRPEHPDGWLFLDKSGKKHAQHAMVQRDFYRATERAGIEKDVSVHTLRSCFATHLLESGVDILTIRNLLGHSCLKSTNYYVRLQKFDVSLKSPLDSLPKKRGRKAKVGIAHG